jgi:hypothetical protein
VTDEFHPLLMVDSHDHPVALIEEDDVVISFNFLEPTGTRIN